MDVAYKLTEPEIGYGQLHAALSDTGTIPLAVLHDDHHLLSSPYTGVTPSGAATDSASSPRKQPKKRAATA